MTFARRHPRFVAAALLAIVLYAVVAALLQVSQLALVIGALVLLVALVVAAAAVIGPGERAANKRRSERLREVSV